LNYAVAQDKLAIAFLLPGMEENSNSKNNTLPVSILVAAVLISGSIIYAVGVFNSGGRAGKTSADLKSAAADQALKQEISPRDVVLGDPKAPVTLIEYGDYQCPFCGKFFKDVEPPLRENYIKTGKVKMVFRNFQFLGPESTNAAEAAECAKDQGKFWTYHDALYAAELKDGEENNGNLKKELFIALAKSAGLDINAFTSCYDSGKYAAQVQKDTEDGQALGVNSTPTTFINGEKTQGALPYSQFQTIIENALKVK